MLLVVQLIINLILPISATSGNGDTPDSSALTLSESTTESGVYEVVNGNARSGFVVHSKVGSEVYADVDCNLYMRIDDTRFILAEEVTFYTHELLSSSVFTENSFLSPALVNDIQRISNKLKNGDIELTEPLAIYIPQCINSENTTKAAINIDSTRTYTGYKGWTYYEELLVCNGNSLEFNVCNVSDEGMQYFEKVLEAGVETGVDSVMSNALPITWTLVTLLGQSVQNTISTVDSFEHTAKLFENKYRKYTYVVEGGQLYLGSICDYTYSYSFGNYINIPGQDFQPTGRTDTSVAISRGYTNADEYAYRYYLYSAYNSLIEKYYFESDDGEVNVYVDSLF